MNSVRSNNLSLKYQRFTPQGCKDIGIRKFEWQRLIPLCIDLCSFIEFEIFLKNGF